MDLVQRASVLSVDSESLYNFMYSEFLYSCDCYLNIVLFTLLFLTSERLMRDLSYYTAFFFFFFLFRNCIYYIFLLNDVR